MELALEYEEARVLKNHNPSLVRKRRTSLPNLSPGGGVNTDLLLGEDDDSSSTSASPASTKYGKPKLVAAHFTHRAEGFDTGCGDSGCPVPDASELAEEAAGATKRTVIGGVIGGNPFINAVKEQTNDNIEVYHCFKTAQYAGKSLFGTFQCDSF